MAKNAKCKYCLEEILPKSKVKKIGQKQYHAECYKKFVAEQYESKIKPTDDKSQLYDYINKLYETAEVDPKILAQMDKYNKEYDLSYERILLTLIYYYEIRESEVRKEFGIGIIPYVYKEAGDFWITSRIANERNAGINTKETITAVKCRVPKNRPKVDLINIDDL